MGEEWRKGWHPERVPPASSDDGFLIVGAGPAGLECARVLGRRGYSVHIAEARQELGGRVTTESRLPGLAAWARVRDYRLSQLNRMQNVEILRNSRVSASEILEFGAKRVVLATGARWRHDGIGRANSRAIKGFGAGRTVITPDDLYEGVSVSGPVVVFDDDHYYLGGVLAEKLRHDGLEVILITPAERVSAWTVNTLEQYSIQKRVLELGIDVLLNRNIIEFAGAQVISECIFTGRQSAIAAATVLTLTSRQPNEELTLELTGLSDAVSAAGIASVTSIGDCWAPSTIAAAVYAGHRHAREFDCLSQDVVGFRRELTALDDV
jgi:dimethylamine/trimethylamine dehydrogenase